jgi:hypothetical protein
MRRLLFGLIPAILMMGLGSGCSEESQPNAAATTDQVADPNFGKNAGDMMKAANSGLDKKKPGQPAAK